LPEPKATKRGEVLWAPTADSIAASRVGAFLRWLEQNRGLAFSDYQQLWQWSVDDLAEFWGALWDFISPLADGSPLTALVERSMPGARWFPDVRLNWAENALCGADEDIVLLARSQTRADEQWTRGDLRVAVARARAGLRRLGVGPGDRVAAYLPNVPESVIALLATASLGAIWASCAPELGTQSVLDRFTQIEPTVLLAVDGYRYGAKDIDRREAVQTIQAGLPSLVSTVHLNYLHPESEFDGLTWRQLLAEPGELVFDRVEFGHPLWILFSSGTTGLPKAIVHSHGGITLELAKSHQLQSDLGPGDCYFVYCTTTWVMWNILVSGLLTGAAIVLMDGDPASPDLLALWQLVAETKTTVLGCGASLLIAGLRAGLRPCQEVDLSALKGVFVTGSPLPADGFRWVYESVTATALLQSASGGTDVCTSFVGGSPMLSVRAGEIACRCLGVHAEALDADGSPVVDKPGELVLSAPMPSMPIYFWNDPDGDRYLSAYFDKYPGKWRHGDWVVFTADGSCQITGRSDGTLNRGGVRLGTAEFYAILDNSRDFPEIEDSLLIHLEDANGGPGTLRLFVALRPESTLDDTLRSRINHALRTQLSPRHRPDRITQVPEIPYNLTGKKLEIPIKRILLGADPSQVVAAGALRNPHSVTAFVQLVANEEVQERPGARRTPPS
jgi:acetoacetyl-CoA synthetase